ncbi:hypothetical protein E2C01_005265 [Portunus trituberculatus]|uniref:Uncharacterized protein n=1 Tax=Portunus trituberculatus TaxID=210409 RepID=A0A5B7CTK1_PORTR|nr:hypothetical protein [Portunus trituberculatus]
MFFRYGLHCAATVMPQNATVHPWPVMKWLHVHGVEARLGGFLIGLVVPDLQLLKGLCRYVLQNTLMMYTVSYSYQALTSTCMLSTQVVLTWSDERLVRRLYTTTPPPAALSRPCGAAESQRNVDPCGSAKQDQSAESLPTYH